MRKPRSLLSYWGPPLISKYLFARRFASWQLACLCMCGDGRMRGAVMTYCRTTREIWSYEVMRVSPQKPVPTIKTADCGRCAQSNHLNTAAVAELRHGELWSMFPIINTSVQQCGHRYTISWGHCGMFGRQKFELCWPYMTPEIGMLVLFSLCFPQS